MRASPAPGDARHPGQSAAQHLGAPSTEPPLTQPQPQPDSPPAPPAPGPEQQPHTQDAPLGDAGQRALDAMKAELAAAKAQVKELSPLAEEARKAAEAQKSEQQKLTEQLQQAQREAAESRLALLRVQVGTAKGLPPALAERLQGDSEEAMAADADRLMSSLPGTPPGPAGPPGAGDAGRGGKPAPLDMNALLRAAAGH